MLSLYKKFIKMKKFIWVDGYWSGNPRMLEDLAGHILSVADIVDIVKIRTDDDISLSEITLRDGRTLISTADFFELVILLDAAMCEEDQSTAKQIIADRDLLRLTTDGEAFSGQD